MICMQTTPERREVMRKYNALPENKARRKNAQRLRYQQDPDYRKKVREYQKSYRNSTSGRERSRNQIDNYLKDPKNKIRHRLRTRMYHLLKGIRKAANSEELIGCSASELKTYLEGLFQEGMTWDNYGRNGWHVDHIKPCALFDLTNPKEQRKCFHFTNLQPLWEHDNLSKGILEKPLTTHF